jgi:UDP-glucose 4-epimerase
VRILVTGGCGFVGTALVDHLLDAGAHVIIVDDLSRGRLRPGDETRDRLTFIPGDIRDHSLLQQACEQYEVEGVAHLAAMHFIPDCDADPEACLSVNVEGTQSVLDATLPVDSVRGVVFASTAAVYAPDSGPHSERSKLLPTDVYGMSKLAAEQLVRRASARHGKPAGVARLFNVYGPGETNPHLIPTIFSQASERGQLSLGNLDTARDYVFTDDVAKGLSALMDEVARGRSLLCNLGTGTAISGREVVARVEDLLGTPLEIEVDPTRVRRSDRPTLCADPAYAGSVLGWRPLTTFAQGLIAARAEPTQ